jgi:hypothetical protein
VSTETALVHVLTHMSSPMHTYILSMKIMLSDSIYCDIFIICLQGGYGAWARDDSLPVER